MSESEIKVLIPSTLLCLPHRYSVNVSVTVVPILTPNPSNPPPTPTAPSTTGTMSPMVFANSDTTTNLPSTGHEMAYSPTSTLTPTGSPSGPPGGLQNEVYVTNDGHPSISSTISGPGVDNVLPPSPLIAPLARVLRDFICKSQITLVAPVVTNFLFPWFSLYRGSSCGRSRGSCGRSRGSCGRS